MKWMSPAFGALCIFTAGCSHMSSNSAILMPDYLLAHKAHQVTFVGDNERPRFSPNGKKLIYSSRLRDGHKGSQIYEMDLDTLKERRMTFSDGDAFDATYISEGEVLYSSTTDEIKERPLINKIFDKEYPPSDLYMSDLYGTEIVRLTQQPGYDGQGLFLLHPTKPAILFTSRRGELTGLYRLDLEMLPVSLLSAESQKEKRFPSLSADGKQLVWAERDLKSGRQSLVSMKFGDKAPQIFKSDEGEYSDIFFAPRPPARLFYSIKRKGERFSQIESYHIEKNCTQVVLKGEEHLTSPSTSNDLEERLAFTREFKGQKQIYIIPLPSDLGPCLEPSPQANLKK